MIPIRNVLLKAVPFVCLSVLLIELIEFLKYASK